MLYYAYHTLPDFTHIHFILFLTGTICTHFYMVSTAPYELQFVFLFGLRHMGLSHLDSGALALAPTKKDQHLENSYFQE